MKLLVVEDEKALAQGLKFNFEQEGYTVLTAEDGPTAIRHFEECYESDGESIDLVVLDLMLPGMSGYEVCREIRNDTTLQGQLAARPENAGEEGGSE